MDNEKFGNFIKELRSEKGLTQKELGEKLNITDKAISKWERGISFPDIAVLNSLADFFAVDVSELLNGERGKKEKIDIDKKIEEAVEKYKDIENKRNIKIRRIKKYVGIASLVVFILTLLLQLGYYFVLRRYNFEYVLDILPYIVNELMIISLCLSALYCISKLSNRKIMIASIFTVLTVVNIAFMANNAFKNNCIVSISGNFSSEVILKVDKQSGAIKIYKDPKLFIFARPKEQFQYESYGKVKRQWLTNDICSITYLDRDGNIREYVATFGDRGNGISYYYVTNALRGDWQVLTQNGETTQLLSDNKGIRITKNGVREQFAFSDCKQFGTIALVLYKEDVPKYVVALDENCELDDDTDIIKKDGTITLCEVSMDKTKKESLYCMTYKGEDLANYDVISVKANDYELKNGLLYISYDGKNNIEVPGDFSQMISGYKDNQYQISKEKTVFYYKKDDEMYLVYSDNMGKSWNTVKLESEYSIENIQFITKDIGYMLKFYDVVVGSAFGKISKTEDGGKTWNDIYFGMGESDKKVFSSGSQIRFLTEEIGFLTMPNVMGTYQELYITRDGGSTFEEVKIISSSIYDFYELPTLEDGIMKLEINQGSDADYNGGDYKEFYSQDYGNTWKVLEK